MTDSRCPRCGSEEIAERHCFASIYGVLSEHPSDFCKSCGFKSAEPFCAINWRASRDIKIETILNAKWDSTKDI